MGRVFEKRKHKMFARYAKMSRTFTKIGKEIAIAVKAGGGSGDPDSNSRLRAIIANAKAINMPKTNIDAAISRATSKQDKDFEEVIYEGKGPHSVAMIIETATDNPTRTVASLRSYFNKKGGQLLVSGSLEFLFERKGIFRIKSEGINPDEFELDMIDAGLEELDVDDEGYFNLSVAFTDFGKMQHALEERKIEIVNAELQRIPTQPIELTEEQEAEFNILLDVIEEDDDVVKVYTNLG
ncbi:MAG: YebC/PmpR family DNA-binding transcriptional regulator [Bacteroidota bacterium]